MEIDWKLRGELWISCVCLFVCEVYYGVCWEAENESGALVGLTQYQHLQIKCLPREVSCVSDESIPKLSGP